MIDRGTRLLRVATASVRRARTAVSALSLIAILIGGLTYLTFGALGVDPTRPGIRVRVPLAESGGLLPNQDVTLRGVPVGRVEAVELDDAGVTAVALIDGRTRIPVDTAVRVSGLSPAGEQYLDFRPQTSGGPFLADGSVIEPGRAEIPVTLAQTLANADGALAQLDPQKLATIRRELGSARRGRRSSVRSSTAERFCSPPSMGCSRRPSASSGTVASRSRRSPTSIPDWRPPRTTWAVY